MLIRLIVYTVVLSFVFNIDHRAHAGGFFCGAFLAFVLPQGEPDRSQALIWNVLSFLGVLLVLVSFVARANPEPEPSDHLPVNAETCRVPSCVTGVFLLVEKRRSFEDNFNHVRLGPAPSIL